MEALVNYSSEDEQDELGYQKQKAAERGGGGGSPTLRRPNSRSCGGGGGDSDTNTNERSTTGNGKGSSSRHNNNYREETHNTNKHITTSSYRRSGGGGATSSSYHSRDNDKESSNRTDRDNRYKRDTRDSRNMRDSRDYKSHERRNTTKERHDYKRENEKYRDCRRDERSHHHNRYSAPSSSSHYSNSSGNNNNNNSSNRNSNGKSERYSSSSSSNNTRDERARHSDTGRRHQNRSRDEREERSRDEREDRSNRHERGARHSQRVKESRSRSRSRSSARQSPLTPKERNERHAPQEPLEQARLSALEMERKLNTYFDEEPLQQQQSHHQQQKTNIDKWSTPAATECNPAVPVVRRIEALLSLPLSDMTPKPASIIAVTSPPPPLPTAHLPSSAATVTAADSEPAVIQLPSYYNPSVINPNKYVEQMQKRKLLWAKKSDDSATKWNHAQFSQDTDGKVASKFMRLMGIKSAGAVSAPPEPEKVAPIPTPDVKSREAMFTNMEQQYEVARQATHTMRGVGLGFGSQTRPF